MGSESFEVDGSHHFTSPDGQPDAVKYADSVRGDRDLKLSGYEVFRFGATELQDPEQARTLHVPSICHRD
jgi:very-short-patch-repair endonuclease